jgi:hypothetical protein
MENNLTQSEVKISAKFQIKRFDYDTSRGIRHKIEFPFSYSSEISVLNKKFYLRGVIIHRGKAESGHYISYVHSRKEKNIWYCFNDQQVTTTTEQIALAYVKIAYLLVYDQKRYQAEIPQCNKDLSAKIQKKNIIQNKIRIMLNLDFFNLVYHLVFSNYIPLGVSYLINVMPYTTFPDKASAI